MKKLISSILLALVCTASNAEPLKTVFNPFTGKQDYITRIDSNTVQGTGTCTSTSNSNGTVSINCVGGGGGSSSLQVTRSGVQITSPTASLNFYSGDFGLSASGGTTSQIFLNPSTTDYIHNNQTSTAQSATFFVTSGTVSGPLDVGAFVFVPNNGNPGGYSALGAGTLDLFDAGSGNVGNYGATGLTLGNVSDSIVLATDSLIGTVSLDSSVLYPFFWNRGTSGNFAECIEPTGGGVCISGLSDLTGDVVFSAGPSLGVSGRYIFNGNSGNPSNRMMLLSTTTATFFVPVQITSNTILSGTTIYQDNTASAPTTWLARGSGATSSTFWRGDGTWATPSGGTGSGIVSPGTFTWTNNQGIIVSTLTASESMTLTSGFPDATVKSTFSNSPTSASTAQIYGAQGNAVWGGLVSSPNAIAVGVSGQAVVSGGATLGNSQGGIFVTQNLSTNTIQSAVGVEGQYLGSSGTATKAYGVYAQSYATIGSTITTNYGLYVAPSSPTVPASGYVATNYGIYIDSQTGSVANFGLYESGTAQNYLGGPLSVNFSTSAAGLPAGTILPASGETLTVSVTSNTVLTANYGACINNDTTPVFPGETGHFPCVLGVTADVAASQNVMYGIEGRTNVLGKAPLYGGVLGLATHTSTQNSTTTIMGLIARTESYVSNGGVSVSSDSMVGLTIYSPVGTPIANQGFGILGMSTYPYVLGGNLYIEPVPNYPSGLPINTWPTARTANLFVNGNANTNPEVVFQNAGAYFWMTLGRSGEDADILIPSGSNQLLTGNNAGDLTLMATSSSNKVVIGAGSGQASFYVNPTSVTVNGALTTGTSTYAAVVSSGTIIPNAALSNIFVISLASNITLNGPTNGTNGQKVEIRLIQDGATRTITLSSDYIFGTDITSLTFSAGGSKTDELGVIYNGTKAKWEVVSKSFGF